MIISGFNILWKKRFKFYSYSSVLVKLYNNAEVFLESIHKFTSPFKSSHLIPCFPILNPTINTPYPQNPKESPETPKKSSDKPIRPSCSSGLNLLFTDSINIHRPKK